MSIGVKIKEEMDNMSRCKKNFKHTEKIALMIKWHSVCTAVCANLFCNVQFLRSR